MDTHFAGSQVTSRRLQVEFVDTHFAGSQVAGCRSEFVEEIVEEIVDTHFAEDLEPWR